MKKILFFTLAVILQNSSHATESKDFDGDGRPDTLSIVRRDDNALVSLGSSSSASEKTFSVSVLEGCGNVAVYSGAKLGDIVVDQSCSGRQAQVYREFYSWNNSLKTWVLHKIVRGESMDQIDGILPSLSVEQAVCCLPIENSSDAVKIKTQEQSAVELNRELEVIALTFKDNNSLAVAIKGWSLDMSVGLAASLTDKNIAMANDLAYYLWRQSRPEDAAIILQQLILVDPKRVVALLNLADALWDIGPEAFKIQAKEYYGRYNETMRGSNKAKLIPDRVQQRM